MDISVIIPVYNGEKWIDNCFNSILNQCLHDLKVEICVCNDGSTDATSSILSKWEEIFHNHCFSFKVVNHKCSQSLGCGVAKNSAVLISSGKYLCFQDVDDLMLPERLIKQFAMANSLSQDYILGSKFTRDPKDSTLRYTKWANDISDDKLSIQIFTSNGPTIIMPTWFMHRSVFDRVRGFSEKIKGEPEDLIFFYKHLDLGGKLYRVNEVLVSYTYHMNSTTHSVHEDTIWNIRMERLQETVLRFWRNFTIWNAGKQGRKFYNSLKEENRKKVVAFCDIDKNKIGKFYTPFDSVRRVNKQPIEIIHYSKATPPIIICVKMDMSDGVFEENLNSLNLEEGNDYIIFS